MEKIIDSISISDLAKLIGGKVRGEDVSVKDAAGIEDVEAKEITWVENQKALKKAVATQAAAIIISKELYELESADIAIPCIIAANPKQSYAKVLSVFYKRIFPERGIAKTAVIGKGVILGNDISIGEYAVIEDNTVIGDGVSLFPHTYIGRNVTVGGESIIYPFAVIHNRTKVGSRVIIHSGAVIGGDGFGFVDAGGAHQKIPQTGIVEIGDDVEIGANVTIDRATTGVTKIGNGSKIDNLVQIGHNCIVGKNCIMVSQSGIAGSTTLGDHVTLAAQAGTTPHTKIGSFSLVAGRGGVTHDLPSNSVVSGFPARPHREALKIQAATQRLPATLNFIKSLEKRIEVLEEKIMNMKK